MWFLILLALSIGCSLGFLLGCWWGARAREITMREPRNPERTVALRKLLEVKDAAVRAAIFK